MVPKAIDVKVLKNYKLELLFNNNEKRIFDVKPYFKFSIFNELKEKEKFEKVKISGLPTLFKGITSFPITNLGLAYSV